MLDLDLEAEQEQTFKRVNGSKGNNTKINYSNHVENNCNGKKSGGVSSEIMEGVQTHHEDQQGSSSRRRETRNQKKGICDIIGKQLEHLGKG